MIFELTLGVILGTRPKIIKQAPLNQEINKRVTTSSFIPIMEKAAGSFFPHTMLSVDERLVDEDGIFHLREADDILSYIDPLDDSSTAPDLRLARQIRTEVVDIVSKATQQNHQIS